jgi:hypothetical protein
MEAGTEVVAILRGSLRSRLRMTAAFVALLFGQREKRASRRTFLRLAR